jgi:Domain of unknown function (DUF4412)
MKYILPVALAALFAGAAMVAHAQWNGKLTYKVANTLNTTSTLMMVYYQNGNNARVDAWSVSQADTTKILNTQDTLLYNISGLTTIHLQYKTGRAYLQKNTSSITQQLMASKGKSVTATIETKGPETVNGYPCTHYVMVTPGMGNKPTTRDVWVTQSLGNPSIQVMGSYLYYTPDNDNEIKLLAAGAAGVVVKTTVTVPGATMTTTLTAVDTKTPPASMFKVPSWYSLIDETNMPMPTKN